MIMIWTLKERNQLTMSRTKLSDKQIADWANVFWIGVNDE